ncbi:tetratricopeptide repeat protein, partial [Chloroflexota bacterium]
ITLGNLGNLLLYLGAYDEAKDHYERALRVQREIGARNDEALSVGNLGLVYHYLGDDETARRYSYQALQMAQETGERRTEGAMWMKLGHALAGLGLLDEAAKAYWESVTLRRETGWPILALEPLAGLARVALAQGDEAQAQALVEEILEHLESGGALDGIISPFQVFLTCYCVLEAGGDSRALEILATAHDQLQERAAKITDEKLRRSYLENVVAHRELLQAFERAGSHVARMK